jgi:hypothetical protein
VAVYRGVFLYGDSGNGKSSLINAGLLPHARRLGFEPVRVRVQPRAGEELVIEPIEISDDGTELLPSPLLPQTSDSSRVVLSIAEFGARVRAAAEEHRPLLVFDQFEEILTLFEDEEATAARGALTEMIVRLLGEPLPLKLLFAFREDYLGRVKQLLGAHPELVDQALRLGPPSDDSLETIIRGPFDRFPGRFERELDSELAQRLRAALAERFGTGDVSLSEVQTVCLRLWGSADPGALLAAKGVQGVLEEELGEALDVFPADLRAAAVALLSEMVTSAGTRNVITAGDLRQRVRAQDDQIAPALLDEALERLEQESRLVRRERRRDLYLYEITSEFLVPWISQRREELRLVRERRRERRRLMRILGLIGGGLLIVSAIVAAFVVSVDRQRAAARDARRDSEHRGEVAAAQIQGRVEEGASLAESLRRFMAAGSAVTSQEFESNASRWLGPAGFPAAAWVQQVPASGRAAYERRIGQPIVTRDRGGRIAPVGSRPSYLPATLVSSIAPMAVPGTDLGGVSGMAAALARASAFGDVRATPLTTLRDGAKGLFLIMLAPRRTGERGFAVVFASDAWLRAAATDTATLQLTVGASSTADHLGAATVRRSFTEAGQRFDVVVPQESVNGAAAVLPWMILAGGLVLAALAGALGLNAKSPRRRRSRWRRHPQSH